ncbi:MAG: sigma-70 family RNA polymerase sigma factor [Deltaproteobacteria bacterium]|jgi:RNA polymerase sigma factor (sigma-70 family)
MVHRGELERIYEVTAPRILQRLRSGFSYYNKSGENRFVRVVSAFDREEILQETFGRFTEQWDKGNYDPTRPAEPYLMRIAFFTTLQYTGRQSREIPDEDVEIRWAEAALPVQSAEEKLVTEERAAQVRAFLESLSEEDKRICALRFQEDLSQAKIGERIGMSRDHVQRALRRLKRRLAEFFEDQGWLSEP